MAELKSFGKDTALQQGPRFHERDRRQEQTLLASLIGGLAVSREIVLLPRDGLGIDFRDAGHLVLPWLEVERVQPSTNRLVRNGLVRRAALHVFGEKPHSPP